MRRIVVFFNNGNRATFDADKIIFVSDTKIDVDVLTEHPDWAIVNRNAISFMRFMPEAKDD